MNKLELDSEESVPLAHGRRMGRIIVSAFSTRALAAAALKFLSDLSSYAPPICIGYIIQFTEEPDSRASGNRAFAAAAVMTAASFMMGLCNQWWYQLVMIDGMHARTAIQACVFSKLLRVSPAALRGQPGLAATVMNLQSTDCRSIEFLFGMWMYIWAAPLQTVVTT